MILAAVDTSSKHGSLVLAERDGNAFQILAEASWQKQAMHSEVATLELEKVLLKAGKSLTDLTQLAVNVGPGSFTG